jgi:hypothetical protein
MRTLTPEGRQRLADIAARHGFGPEAAEALLRALVSGCGTQAQFSHADLGGMGQWSQGGMLMIGDMFNDALKARVAALCGDLAPLAAGGGLFEAECKGGDASRPAGGSDWWPADLGRPSTSGGQNDVSYAYFPQARRLAVRRGGRVTVYDAGDHAITGVSQQQGGTLTLRFSSTSGVIDLDDLAVVTP